MSGHVSMKSYSSSNIAVVANVQSKLRSNVTEGKVVVVVEGDDDKKFYENYFSSSTVFLYPVGGCDKYPEILTALSTPSIRQRLLAIKDADFDRLNGISHPYDNLFLTDTHDMEGMIVRNGIPDSLCEEDKKRCLNVNVSALKHSLIDISYMRWHNNVNHLGLNFDKISVSLSMTEYMAAVVAKTNSTVVYDIQTLNTFKNANRTADLDELTNGHDLFEKIYIEAKAADKRNYPKEKFFNRLRSAFSFDDFKSTGLYKDLKAKESTFAYSLF